MDSDKEIVNEEIDKRWKEFVHEDGTIDLVIALNLGLYDKKNKEVE